MNWRLNRIIFRNRITLSKGYLSLCCSSYGVKSMKRTFKLLCSIISFAIVLACLPLESIADEISDSLKCRSLSEASYTVSENVITTWPGHANIEIVFTNTGDAPICNWNYTFEFIYNIENPYNCTVLEHEGDLYTVGNSGWNKDINPGESVTIGFTASSNDGSDIEYMPSFYLLNNANNILPEGSITVDYVEYSDWTSGSSGALIITNNTDSSIGNWTIAFSANRPVTDAYDVSFSVNDDGTYTISGSSYSDITAGGTYQIGIQCGEHDSSVPFEISNLIVSSSTLALALNEDTNNNGVPDVSEIDYNGFITTPTPTVTDTPTVTEEPTPTTTDAPTDTPEPTPTEFEVTIDQDLDGDGLYTSEEEMYGTDPNNPDSDGDGVFDGNEIKMIYFPTIADSDGNGILDGDEDFDGDGIINRDEESYDTCPYAADSDYDDIDDYDEIFTYSTDPYEEDSDGDYILDGDELALGLEPTTDTTESVQDNENTQDYSFTSTSEQIAEYNTDDQPFSFSFDIKAAGRVDKYIKAQETGYKYAIEDNSTILGKSPEIVYDYAMKVDSVTVNFTMKNGYEADIDKYCVFYYWEGYNILIPIETEYDYDTGTVYATNSMIGTYCLVDTEQMYDLLGVEETTESSTSFASDYPVYNMLSSTDTTDINYSTSSVYEFNGHEYVLIVADTPLSYLDAVEVCAKEGGYPAVITSDEENGFLYDLRGGLFASCWLGGLVIREGNNRPTVQWITGEDCVYDCWAVLYSGGVEGTLIQGLFYQMNGWAWVDLETATERRVICERPKGSNPDEEGVIISALTFGEEDIELNCYSDSDIDGDGIPNSQELSSWDLGIFDSTTGVHTPATLSAYYTLAESEGIYLNPTVAMKTGMNATVSYRSNPLSDDVDQDSSLDTTDFVPFKTNEDLIVILSLKSDKDCVNDSRALMNNYNNCLNRKCELIEFEGYDSFIEAWISVGNPTKALSLPYSPFSVIDLVKNYSDYYCYNVTDVVLVSHGISVDGIRGMVIKLGQSEYLYPDISDEFFEMVDAENCYPIEGIDFCRDFDSLDMLICDSATQLRPDVFNKNLAETFISHFTSITNVYAFDCDCSISFFYDSERVAWVGRITNNVLMGQALMQEYSYIKTLSNDDLEDYLESSYPDVYCGYSGQVKYFRLLNDDYYQMSDLYSGTDDIEYIQRYAISKENIEADFYRDIDIIYKYAINVETSSYYDPVLE